MLKVSCYRMKKNENIFVVFLTLLTKKLILQELLSPGLPQTEIFWKSFKKYFVNIFS